MKKELGSPGLFAALPTPALLPGFTVMLFVPTALFAHCPERRAKSKPATQNKKPACKNGPKLNNIIQIIRAAPQSHH